MSKVCSTCNGNGLLDGCPSCGVYNYGTTVRDEAPTPDGFRIPKYYQQHLWEEDKMVLEPDNDHKNAVVQVLNRLVTQTEHGSSINSSYAFLLPYGHGKKTAMFSIIQHYLRHGKTVAPVVDIATLAILENNFRINDKEAVAQWRKMIEADLVCVYGVDFSARYYTMKLFLNLCSIRGLQGRPTLLFAENALIDLRSNAVPDNLTEDNNQKDIGCRLSHPFILDGTTKVRNN